MWLAAGTGIIAGTAMGYVLQRGQLCFLSMFAAAWLRRPGTLLHGWLLGVAIASVGLSVLYLTPWSHGLNTGLAFRPVADVVGGLVIGVGMAVASSCTSGLFFKLGSGMLGAGVGIGGWVVGELSVRNVHLPGPTVLSGGTDATFTGVLGVPRLLGSLVLLVVVALVVRRLRGADVGPEWQWAAPTLGLALGAATILGWVLARVGGSGFGPSTVGASAGVAAGTPNWWLIAFLAGLICGGALAARHTGVTDVRGETPMRYLRLLTGGFLLGAGGWLAGGCNLGHGLSGAAQLNVSSWVVVLAMAAGVGGSVAVVRALAPPAPA